MKTKPKKVSKKLLGGVLKLTNKEGKNFKPEGKEEEEKRDDFFPSPPFIEGTI